MKERRGLLVDRVKGSDVKGIDGTDPQVHLERVLTEMQ
jgi:hypothetical protein